MSSTEKELREQIAALREFVLGIREQQKTLVEEAKARAAHSRGLETAILALIAERPDRDRIHDAMRQAEAAQTSRIELGAQIGFLPGRDAPGGHQLPPTPGPARPDTEDP